MQLRLERVGLGVESAFRCKNVLKAKNEIRVLACSAGGKKNKFGHALRRRVGRGCGFRGVPRARRRLGCRHRDQPYR